MNIEVVAVTVNHKKNYVEIDGIDLDGILLNKWWQELEISNQVTFRFDLNKYGDKIYLYKVVKSKVDLTQEKSMESALTKLNAKNIYLGNNFIFNGES